MSEGENQTEFLIQTRVKPPGGGPQLEGDRAADVIRGTREKLDAAAAVAREAGHSLHGVFIELAPDRGAVEFSVDFEGEAGVPMIARGKASASITITLEWQRAAAP
jgi:hypothetical protein